MDALVVAHVVAALVLVALSALVAGWGLARARAIGAGSSAREGRGFAQLLQLSHTLVALTGVLGIALLIEGHRSGDPLHARVYGPFMVVAIVAAYGYRSGDAARNIRIFAVASLVILALGARAFATGT